MRRGNNYFLLQQQQPPSLQQQGSCLQQQQTGRVTGLITFTSPSKTASIGPCLQLDNHDQATLFLRRRSPSAVGDADYSAAEVEKAAIRPDVL